MSLRARTIIYPLLAGVVVVAGWYGRHATLAEDMQFLLPTPGDILRALRDNQDVMVRAFRSERLPEAPQPEH